MAAIWQWEGDDGWHEYDPQDASLLEQAFSDHADSQLVCNGYD